MRELSLREVDLVNALVSHAMIKDLTELGEGNLTFTNVNASNEDD